MSRIDSLIAKMKLPEKLGQLTMTAADSAVTGPCAGQDAQHITEAIRTGTTGSVLNLAGAAAVRKLQRISVEHSRLRIPLLFGLDILHGYRTLFPVPLAEAALFDEQVWEQTARAAAQEAAAEGLALTFAPMLDIARDPRWGRVVESPGEDPWLAARMAAAKVRGYQGIADPSPVGGTDAGGMVLPAGALASVAKHYCGYGAVTAGREYASAELSERTLREVHLPPFAAAVSAGVAGVMPAFIDIAGIPMSAHTELLRGRLRTQLGFNGVIISDYDAIAELIRHGVAGDLAQAAALALNAGVDIDMASQTYRRGLPVALGRGWVRMQQIDESVRRVLALKERTGLFEDPYRSGAFAHAGSAASAERRALARSVATRAMVLLKNAGGALPLAPAGAPVGTVSRLAVLGPLADASAEMGGPWAAAARPDEHISVLAGLKAVAPQMQLLYAAGVPLQDRGTDGIASALALCESAQAIVLCLGESSRMSGEAASRADPGLPGSQEPLARAVLERAASLRRPVIVVLFCGRPLVAPWLYEQADAVLAAWYPGSEAGHAVADVLCGRCSPSGRTPISWPRSTGQIPLFYGQRPTGRPLDPSQPLTSRYLDVPNDPQFPFGHGLSYTQFKVVDLRATPLRVRRTDTIQVRVDVVNEGARGAEHTVLLFVHDRLASVARPGLELRGWGRIRLDTGQRGTLTLELEARALCFLGPDLEPLFEPGHVELLVGPCADRGRLLSTEVELVA